MKNLILPFLSVVLLSFSANTQAYMTTGGLRAGTDWGITIQQRLTKNMTIEGIVQSSLQREEVIITALVERHYPLIFRGLNLYTGAGLHKGWLSPEASGELVPTGFKDPFGLTFITGAEMTLGRFNFSYDFKPAINVVGGERKFYTQSGVSVRYVFLTNKQYKKKQKAKRKKKRKEEGKGIHLGDGWKIWKKN